MRKLLSKAMAGTNRRNIETWRASFACRVPQLWGLLCDRLQDGLRHQLRQIAGHHGLAHDCIGARPPRFVNGEQLICWDRVRSNEVRV